MEKKLIRIVPTGLTGGPHKGLTFTFLLLYDEHTKRQFTIKAPWSNWRNKPWNPQRLQSIMLYIMERSNVHTRMTESEFLNFELKNFDKVTIKSEYILD